MTRVEVITRVAAVNAAVSLYFKRETQSISSGNRGSLISHACSNILILARSPRKVPLKKRKRIANYEPCEHCLVMDWLEIIN